MQKVGCARWGPAAHWPAYVCCCCHALHIQHVCSRLPAHQPAAYVQPALLANLWQAATKPPALLQPGHAQQSSPHPLGVTQISHLPTAPATMACALRCGGDGVGVISIVCDMYRPSVQVLRLDLAVIGRRALHSPLLEHVLWWATKIPPPVCATVRSSPSVRHAGRARFATHWWAARQIPGWAASLGLPTNLAGPATATGCASRCVVYT